MRLVSLAVALCCVWGTFPAPLRAEPAPPRAAPLTFERPIDGRPTIVLDRLSFPKEVIGAKDFEKHLRRELAKEASQADWGAGRDNRIEYRFEVTQLRFIVEKDAFLIRCAAVGRLPGGQTAKSELSFGGGLGERTKLTKRVLTIVARGVIARLAELERRRRGLA